MVLGTVTPGDTNLEMRRAQDAWCMHPLWHPPAEPWCSGAVGPCGAQDSAWQPGHVPPPATSRAAGNHWSNLRLQAPPWGPAKAGLGHEPVGGPGPAGPWGAVAFLQGLMALGSDMGSWALGRVGEPRGTGQDQEGLVVLIGTGPRDLFSGAPK